YNHLLCLALSNGISRARVEEVLELVGLAGVARRRAGGFSLGMAQRLGIAAALLGDPPVLMLDEPVNGLDPEGVAWVRTLRRAGGARGRSVLLSRTSRSGGGGPADGLFIIGRGRLIAQTAVEAFLSTGSGGFVLVRPPQASAPAELLTAQGATVTRHAEQA